MDASEPAVVTWAEYDEATQELATELAEERVLSQDLLRRLAEVQAELDRDDDANRGHVVPVSLLRHDVIRAAVAGLASVPETDRQEVRDQALRDAAYLIRAEWVCCVEADEGPVDDWDHECCKYSEFAARNAERLIGTPHGVDVGTIYDWEAVHRPTPGEGEPDVVDL